MTGLRNVTLMVNGAIHQLHLEPRRLLVHSLRLDLGLTGTHVGCERAQCGACLVLLDDEPVRSCNLLTVQADGAEVWTIEGLASTGRVDAIQKAFCEKHAVQCGFCTPGMVVCAWELLRRNLQPDEREIRRALCGNLCRCTGYQNIVDAILRAGEIMSGAEGAR
jgi:carbon-monoxide dehydrogenase small subunit